MPLLTIFTPTYNRKKTLRRTYESLCRQSCKDFLWLIIDDGSTDQTGLLVNEWQKSDCGFEIRYCYKKNGGLHTGYNRAIELADTDLMMCVDSDDYIPYDAVEKIQSMWREKGSSTMGGIIGLDCYASGETIGTPLPDQETLNLIDVCVGKVFVSGDKKHVVRTDLFKQVAPMPTFDGEKNFNPYYMILKIAMRYEFLILPSNLCFVEYQTDGMTANQWKQYMDSPNSFAEMRRLYLSFENTPLQFQIRHAIHYVSSSILAKNHKFISQSPRKMMTIAMVPFGFVFSLLTRYMANKRKGK